MLISFLLVHSTTALAHLAETQSLTKMADTCVICIKAKELRSNNAYLLIVGSLNSSPGPTFGGNNLSSRKGPINLNGKKNTCIVNRNEQANLLQLQTCAGLHYS
jgi:hypothetical protein